MTLRPGDSAPPLSGVDEQGNDVLVPDTGFSLLWFNPMFTKFGCKSCQTSLLHELYPEFRVQGCSVYGATFDPPEVNARRNEPHVWRVPMVQVTRREAELWGALRRSSDPWAPYAPASVSYLVDSRGSVTHVYQNPDPQHHANDVLQDLKSMSQELSQEVS